MIWVVMLALWFMLVAGVYLVLSRDVVRCVIGLMLVGNGVNVLLLASGRLGGTTPAVIEAGLMALPVGAANPLPQALVLTAIVIGFALACLSMVMVVGLAGVGAGDDVDALRDAEPEALDPVKPPMAKDERAVQGGQR